MKPVWLYCILRNEAKILPYFLRHYTPWVGKLIFYDDKSTDGTRRIISSCSKSELRDWPGSEGLNDDEFVAFSNEQWKEARGLADWVIWVDCDEFLYHPRMLELLEEYLHAGVTLPQVAGYTMMSKKFPTTDGQIYDEVKTGFPDDIWNKSAIFRENICHTIGRHSVDLKKFTPRPSQTAEIKLLHYRGLGKKYIMERHRRNWDRMPDRCKRLKMGHNTDPDYVGHHSLKWFDEMVEREWSLVL